jgi:hypothetical protein
MSTAGKVPLTFKIFKRALFAKRVEEITDKPYDKRNTQNPE